MQLHYAWTIFQKLFSVDKMKNTGLYEYVYDFPVDYDSNDLAHIFDIHKYLTKKHNIK